MLVSQSASQPAGLMDDKLEAGCGLCFKTWGRWVS